MTSISIPLLFLTLLSSSPFTRFSSADNDNLGDTCPTAETSTNKPIFINGLPCKNPNDINPSDFKSSKLKQAGNTENSVMSSMSIVTATEFPGLNTLGISISRTDLDVDGLVAPHAHPRASEIMFVSQGSVIAGFIDTNNNGFKQTLNEGDVFIVPRGMMHYCFHTGSESATVFSVLNSQNPGVVGVTGALPGPNAYEDVKRMTDVFHIE